MPKVRQPSWAQAPHKPGQSWSPVSPSQPLPESSHGLSWGGNTWHFLFVWAGPRQSRRGRHRDFHSPVTQELGLHRGSRGWAPILGPTHSSPVQLGVLVSTTALVSFSQTSPFQEFTDQLSNELTPRPQAPPLCALVSFSVEQCHCGDELRNCPHSIWGAVTQTEGFDSDIVCCFPGRKLRPEIGRKPA